MDPLAETERMGTVTEAFDKNRERRLISRRDLPEYKRAGWEVCPLHAPVGPGSTYPDNLWADVRVVVRAPLHDDHDLPNIARALDRAQRIARKAWADLNRVDGEYQATRSLLHSRHERRVGLWQDRTRVALRAHRAQRTLCKLAEAYQAADHETIRDAGCEVA